MNPENITRRNFLHGIGTTGALLGAGGLAGRVIADEKPKDESGNVISGFEHTEEGAATSDAWQPFSERRIRIGITGERFTEVSCMGMPSIVPHLRPENNDYKNPFGSEIALFRTSGGGMSRMAVSWDIPIHGGEQGRLYGQKSGGAGIKGDRPPLPPGMAAGGHGGSHGRLTCEFIDAILRDRKPWIDVAQALNLTVAGVVAHESALKDGELLKIPQYVMGG